MILQPSMNAQLLSVLNAMLNECAVTVLAQAKT